MNGMQIDHLLGLIDANVDASMKTLRPEIVAYLSENIDKVADQIEQDGTAEIPTRYGTVTISREDVFAAA